MDFQSEAEKEKEKKKEKENENGGEGDYDEHLSSLDLSSYQLHSLHDIHLPPQLIDLDLTANRLSHLDPRIPHLSRLKKLSLRQNLFEDAALHHLSSSTDISALEELVLRDNKLTQIPDLTIYRDLKVFDISFNEISSLSGLAKISTTLKELYVSKNEVTKIEELNHLTQLHILELGSNRLRVMENLQGLAKLDELWLGRNRIKVVNLCGLKSIRKLSLQSNRLTSMIGFQDCVSLEELYLGHNGIMKMEGLSTLVNLRVLDIASNKITLIEDIETLNNLEDLWLNDNNINSLEGLDLAVLGSRQTLTTIYMKQNPCANVPHYSATLKQFFPNLEQIDSEIL